ncbi:MAG: carboxypeptidase-like regulatory domain-containing protein, partial [Pyrinomonadaceae bacterium]
MSRSTSSTFRPRFVSCKQLLSWLRRLDLHRTANYGVSLIVAFSLLLCSTPAAAQTIVAVGHEWQVDLGFWLRANDLPAKLQGLLPEQDSLPRAQEKQRDRDARVSRIQIYPGDLTINFTEQVSFAAVAYDLNGEPVGGVKIRWSAQEIGLGRPARISQRGNFEPLAPGTYKIAAEARGGTAYATVVVLAGQRKPRPNETPIDVRPASSRQLPSLGLASTKERRQLDTGRTTSLARAGKAAQGSDAGLRRAHTASTTAVAPLPQGGGSDGWNNTNYWSADDPGNTPGDPRGNPADGGAGSSNFQVMAPVLGITGRSIDIQMGLSYNSRLWNKAGTQMTYDIDRGWPAPGWSLGFGKVLYMGSSGGSMIVDSNGTRHPYSGTITTYSYGVLFAGHTTDGTFIDYSTWVN